MITTDVQCKVAKENAQMLRESIEKHITTQEENPVNVAAYAQALSLLNEVEAEICLYSIRKEIIK